MCFALGSSTQSTYKKSVSTAGLIVTIATHALRGGMKSNLVMGPPPPSGLFLKSSKLVGHVYEKMEKNGDCRTKESSKMILKSLLNLTFT